MTPCLIGHRNQVCYGESRQTATVKAAKIALDQRCICLSHACNDITGANTFQLDMVIGCVLYTLAEDRNGWNGHNVVPLMSGQNMDLGQGAGNHLAAEDAKRCMGFFTQS